MAEPLNHKELVTIEGMTISSMWEIAALVDVISLYGPVEDPRQVR